jgi:hypothetical protein
MLACIACGRQVELSQDQKEPPLSILTPEKEHPLTVLTASEAETADILAGFELFTRQQWRQRPAQQQPVVTLRRARSLSLNAAAWEALGGAEAVELLYHPERRIIAIRAAAASGADAYVLRKQTRSTSFLIAFGAFAAWWNIPLDATRRYAPDVPQPGLLFIDVGAPMEPPQDAHADTRRPKEPAGSRE